MVGISTPKHVYTGVDYCRYTCNDHRKLGDWREIVAPEFLREEHAGRKPHNRWLLGYFGRVGEHCFVGENEGGCMIQLSSALAWERWYDAGRGANHCTRMDLQVTYPIDGSPGEYIRTMYELGQMTNQGRHRRADLQLTDTPAGAKMLTVGSRQSEVYGRMYDKYRESKMIEYHSCVRWEIEMKGDTARDIDSYMREHKDEASTTRAVVHQYWESKGMKPFWDTFEGMSERPPSKRTKTDETKIAWLATQVRPTLQTLAEHGKIMAVLDALFGGVLTEEQILAIVAMFNEDVSS